MTRIKIGDVVDIPISMRAQQGRYGVVGTIMGGVACAHATGGPLCLDYGSLELAGRIKPLDYCSRVSSGRLDRIFAFVKPDYSAQRLRVTVCAKWGDGIVLDPLHLRILACSFLNEMAGEGA